MVGRDGIRLMKNKSVGLAPRAAFTLIEVTLAMVIIFFGVTSAVTMFLVGLDWSTDVNIRIIAIETASSAIENVKFIDAAADLDADLVEGSINGFYVVREREDAGGVFAPTNKSAHEGRFDKVTVTVYADVIGDDYANGTQVYKMSADKYFEH